MEISIITPVYNDPRIETCLESVNEQRGDFDVERIIVDSNSTDSTVDIIATYEDHIDHLIREDDEGMYDAINKGIERASGDVVGILNADDRYQDASVLADVAFTMNDPDVDACYGDLLYVNDRDEVVRYWRSGQYAPYKFYLGWMPPHPTFFVKRELYQKFGQFDTSFPIAADYELMMRFLLWSDVTVRYIDRILVRMALGGMSNASLANMLQVIKDMYRAWDKYDRFGKYTAPFLHPVEKIPQFVRKPPSNPPNP